MLKDYLVEVKEDIKDLKVLPRDLEVSTNFPVVIVGPRRAGKTFYLYYLIKNLNLKNEDYLFVNFEDYEVKIEDPTKIIPLHIEIYKKEPKFLFLDEIQSMDNWQNFLYSLAERKKYCIFATGSSSKLLSKEVSSFLRGRFLNRLLLPLSFREYMVFKGTNSDTVSQRGISKIKGLLEEYLRSGGFPEVVLGLIKKKAFVKEYINVIIYKDFIERYNIENPEVAEFLIYSLIQSNTSKISVNKIHKQLKQITKVSNKTIRKYVFLLPETFFVFLCRKFSFSIKKTYLSQPKIYLCDTSLDYDENGIGKKMENAVFLELVRKTLEPNKDLFYFQTKEGYEVDFLIKEEGKIKRLIQVTHANNFDEIDKREIRALIHAHELFKTYRPELIVITWDYEDEKIVSWFNKKAKITFVPLWKWLLGSSTSFS